MSVAEQIRAQAGQIPYGVRPAPAQADAQTGHGRERFSLAVQRSLGENMHAALPIRFRAPLPRWRRWQLGLMQAASWWDRSGRDELRGAQDRMGSALGLSAFAVRFAPDPSEELFGRSARDVIEEAAEIEGQAALRAARPAVVQARQALNSWSMDTTNYRDAFSRIVSPMATDVIEYLAETAPPTPDERLERDPRLAQIVEDKGVRTAGGRGRALTRMEQARTAFPQTFMASPNAALFRLAAAERADPTLASDSAAMRMTPAETALEWFENEERTLTAAAAGLVRDFADSYVDALGIAPPEHAPLSITEAQEIQSQVREAHGLYVRRNQILSQIIQLGGLPGRSAYFARAGTTDPATGSPPNFSRQDAIDAYLSRNGVAISADLGELRAEYSEVEAEIQTREGSNRALFWSLFDGAFQDQVDDAARAEGDPDPTLGYEGRHQITGAWTGPEQVYPQGLPSEAGMQ